MRPEVRRLLKQADRDLENAEGNIEEFEAKRRELGIVRVALDEGVAL